MTEQLESALADEFPFMQRLPEHGGCWFGIDCGDGWYSLLREMCGEIAAAYRAAGRPVDLTVEQVKEKYGQLQFYYHPWDPMIDDIIGRYEERSAGVCEVCGAPGCLRTDLPWIQTLCEEHYARKKDG